MLRCGWVYRTDAFGWPSVAARLNIADGPGLVGLTVSISVITPEKPGAERGFDRTYMARRSSEPEGQRCV